MELHVVLYRESVLCDCSTTESYYIVLAAPMACRRWTKLPSSFWAYPCRSQTSTTSVANLARLKASFRNGWTWKKVMWSRSLFGPKQCCHHGCVLCFSSGVPCLVLTGFGTVSKVRGWQCRADLQHPFLLSLYPHRTQWDFRAFVTAAQRYRQSYTSRRLLCSDGLQNIGAESVWDLPATRWPKMSR